MSPPNYASGAISGEADFGQAVFDLLPGTRPAIPTIASVDELDEMHCARLATLPIEFRAAPERRTSRAGK